MAHNAATGYIKTHTQKSNNNDNDTENEYDSNAVAVCLENGQQLGYLSQKVNKTVAPWLDNGEAVFVEGVSITGGFPGHLGLNIWIEKQKAA